MITDNHTNNELVKYLKQDQVFNYYCTRIYYEAQYLYENNSKILQNRNIYRDLFLEQSKPCIYMKLYFIKSV